MLSLNAEELQDLKQTLKTRVPGHGLPRPFYHRELLYQAELEFIWRGGWLFAGHSCQIPNPGDYFLYEVDDDSMIIVRQDDGTVRAFYNVCRHRGSLICEAGEGSVKRFICPYHQWTYDRAGRLILFRGMQAGIDKSQLGLQAVHTRELEGLIFISLAQEPRDFDAAAEAIASMVRPQGLKHASHPQYIRANFDQYNADDTIDRIAEELAEVTARSATKWAAQGLAITVNHTGLAEFPDPDRNIWYAADRTPLLDGYVSETMDGQQIAPLMGAYTDPDVGTLRVRTLPNLWNHSSCDHSVTTRITPNGLHHTNIRMIWLVDAKAREGTDYQLDKMLPFWLLTSEQDWEICVRQQRGVNSHAYLPGPLSTYKEYNLDRFLRWYLKEMSEALG